MRLKPSFVYLPSNLLDSAIKPASVISLCISTWIMPLAAQTAGQLTPRDLRPTPQATAAQPPELKSMASEPNAIPAGADSLFATLKEVEVIGGWPEFAAPTESLISAVRSRRASLARYYQLSSEIEALYRDGGYPLVRIVLPPQTITDGGVLQLRLVDGFIEAVEASELQEGGRAHVERLLKPLIGQRQLSADTLEHALMLAGRSAGVTLRSTLSPGEAAGGVRLVLQGKHLAAGGSLAADNRLADNLGPWGLTLQGRLNQPFQMGEQFYVQHGTSARTNEMLSSASPRQLSAAGVIWPLGLQGASLNLEWTNTRSEPRPQTGVLGTLSTFERYSIRLSYPLLLRRDRSVTLTATLDATDQRTSAPAFNVVFDHDVLRVLRAGADLQWQVPSLGSLSSTLVFSQGINDWGVRGPDDAARSGVALSRQGMNPGFSKLEASFAFDMALPLGWMARSSIKTQIALLGVLPSSELFSLDGEDALSAFRTGSISDDAGVSLRQELSRPFNTNLVGRSLSLMPYAYAATGRTHTKTNTPALPGWSTAWGAGLKLQWENLGLHVEGGRAHVHLERLNDSILSVKAQVSF